MPKCVAAGTLIATPDGGSKPIEELRVGDRVATTNVTRAVPDGTTTVDPLNWHLVTLHMSGLADSGDVYEIRTLRPLDWILEHDAFPGRTIEFETERSAVDRAYVASVELVPQVKAGGGRLVLSTFTHRDRIVTIRFEGVDEWLGVTPTHRLYSIERADWVLTLSLRPGDLVRTAARPLKIASLTKLEVARVFDIEVEADHAYLSTGADIVSHNCGLAKPGEDLFVGTYNRSRRANLRSKLNLTHTPHHAMQNAVTPETFGRGITINLRKDLHELTATMRAKRDLPNARGHLAADIFELRKILPAMTVP